jgi:hypothetical protein
MDQQESDKTERDGVMWMKIKTEDWEPRRKDKWRRGANTMANKAAREVQRTNTEW